MFSSIQPEKRIPADHPLRKVRELVREVLKELSHSFGKLYSHEGRGIARVGAGFMLNLIAYNSIRIHRLIAA